MFEHGAISLQILSDRSLRSRRDVYRVMSAPVGLLETIMNKVRTLVVACSAMALLGGVGAFPARADDDGWRGHGHEWREREWREREPTVIYESAPPTVVYQQAPPTVLYQPAPPPAVVYEPAPPPVVVAPPPPAVVYQLAPVVTPSPSVDIVFPIRLGH